ncbi:MAG: ROK family protein [Deltaproteobacteria bacterium]|nr:MAG: ROK family protein [Deltaproteobacteria bacterium]
MRPKEELYLGIDLGGTNVRAAVIDGGGHVLGQEKHRLLSREPPQVAEAVVRAAKTACGAAGLPFAEMRGMGIGVAGMVQKGTGVVLAAPNLGWKEVPFVKLMQARAPRIPLWLANDLSMAAWGEREAGAGRGVDDLIVVLVGSGVGAGIIMGGKLREGASGVAGELGHIQVQPGGRQCTCGQRGCLEAYAGGHHLAGWARDDLRIALAAARTAGKHHPEVGGKLLELVGEPEKVTAAAMERAAHEGDALSIRLLEEAGRLLGIALANLVTTLNPSRLLLGGGVLSGSPRMMRVAIAEIDAHASKQSRAVLQISTPELGDQAGVVGAALLARAFLAEAA